MKIEQIIEKILESNPRFKRENLTVRADGRVEYDCGHGRGHTIYSTNNDYIHGCDRCCEDYTIIFPEDLKD